MFFRALYFWSCAQVTAGSNVLGSFSAFCYKFCEQVTTGANVWRFLVYHIIDFVQNCNCYISFSVFYQWFCAQMTARTPMISRVTAWLPKCGKTLRSLERYRVEDLQKNSISPLSPCIIIRLERMKLQTSKKIFASNPDKGLKNKHKKTWMEWNDTKLNIWYFQQCVCVNFI